MRVYLLIISLFMLSFQKTGSSDAINDQAICKELKDKYGYEAYLEMAKFGKSELVKFYGFTNLKDVNFMIVKINSEEKQGGIDPTFRFIKSLYPSRSEIHFTRNDFFCIVLFEEAKRQPAMNIKHSLDQLFFRSGGNKISAF